MYYSPNITREIKLRKMRWGRHVARMGKKGNTYRVLASERDGKRQLQRSSRIPARINKRHPKV